MKEHIHEKVNDFFTDVLNNILRVKEQSVLGRPKELSN